MRRIDSIVPAILAHAAFNAAMNGWMFARLWPSRRCRQPESLPGWALNCYKKYHVRRCA
jgi:hypothetical protein